MYCVNIFVLNKCELVAKEVEKALGGPRKGRRRILKASGRLVNAFVSVDEVAKHVADEIAEAMPEELQRRGFDAVAHVRFRKDTLIVVTVRLLAVNYEQLAEDGNLSRSAAQWLQRFDRLPGPCRRFVQRMVLKFVAGEMIKRSPFEVQEDLAAGGVEARVVALPMEKEAAFLFAALDDIGQNEHETSDAKLPTSTNKALWRKPSM